MLHGIGSYPRGVTHYLSVPYFTGFVMLLAGAGATLPGTVAFSPLFYGIRDVTFLPILAMGPVLVFQSPILRDS